MTDTPKQVNQEKHSDPVKRPAEGELGSCCSSACCATADVESV
jgi:hypothetical protein